MKDHRVKETARMRKSDEILIRWLVTESGETLSEIASKTQVDQNTLITLKQEEADIKQLDPKYAEKLIEYAKQVGAE